MYRNPFLVARFIFFAILLYLNLLTLIFAALNIAAVKSSGISAPGAAAFLVSNCCFLFLFLLFGLGGIGSPMVKIECGWTAILSILHLAATVTMNVNGPPTMCQPALANWAACATSSVLVPVTWLTTFTLIAYCLMLTISAIIHAKPLPGMWSVAVRVVPWFVPGGGLPAKKLPEPKAQSTKSRPVSFSGSEVSVQLSKPNNDVEAALPNVETSARITDFISAPWAKNRAGRRGIDPPFFTKGNNDNDSVPEARPRPPRATRYFELSWFRPKSQAQPAVTPQTPGGVFGRAPGDEDDPIPLPRLSEWIRADAEKGINVHTIPPISPLTASLGPTFRL